MMGAANVAAVYACWSTRLREQHIAFRVLVFMALVAKDGDDPPRFFGGRDMLVHAVGRSPCTDAERHAAQESVRAAIKQLITAGAVVRFGRARPGRNPEYHLRTLPTSGQAEPALTTQAEPVSTGQAEPAQQDRLSLLKGQAEPAPKEEQEQQERVQEEISPTSATTGAGAARQHLRDAVGWWR